MTYISTLLEKHNTSRLQSLNLIVSENRMTPQAQAPLSSDIQSRYAANFYAGTNAAQEIISHATKLARDVFDAEYVNLSPISGNMSLIAIVFSLTKYMDLIGRIPPFFPGGGYPFNYGLFDRRPLPLPFSEIDWQIDLPRTLSLLEINKPPLVVLGSSIVTYPMPVKEIAEVVHGYGGLVAYDGSHSLGLIAGKQYQDPLREGADVLFGSTHKTFPGPQGGIIVTNNEEIHSKVEEFSNFTPLNGPTLICNPHLARIAATGIVLEETRWEEYAEQVVKNTRTIAAAMHEAGIPLHGVKSTNFPELTYCHQVVTDYPIPEGKKLRDHLANHRINVDGFVRVGTSEITRLGFKEKESKRLGEIIASLLNGKDDDTSDLDMEIDQLIQTHSDIVL